MPIVVLAFSTASKRRPTADLRHLALPAMWALAFAFLGVGGAIDVPEAILAGVLAGAHTLAWMTLPVLRRRFLGASAILTVVVIALLRDAAGGSASGYGPLVLWPVLAVALYGDRGQLWRTIAAVAVALVAPTVLIGSPHYAPGSWRLSVFLILSAAVVGAVVQELLLRERRGAAKHVRLLGAIGDGVLVTDLGGRILEVNQALCSTTGFTAGELLGQVPPYPTWPAGHRATIGAAYRSAIAAGGGEFEAPLQRRDGTPVHAVIRVAVEPGTAHDAPAVIATVKDVTEPVRLRETIREERDRTAAVIAGMDEGFCVTRDGAILDVNPALCRMTGFSREQLVGAATPLPFWPPEALAELEAAREQVRATGSGSAEVTFMRADGSRFPGDFTSTRLPSDPDGSPTFLNTIRDVTERKAAERAAARRADELAAIAAVTRAVSRAEPAEARAKVCEVALEMTAAASAAIWEPGPGGDLRPVCMLAGSPEPDQALDEAIREAAAAGALATGEAGRAQVASDAPRRAAHAWYQPIAAAGGVHGVLEVQWADGGEAPRDAVSVLELLADEAAIALARAEAHDELERLVRTDALTGLPNRRALEERLEGELATVRRTGLPLALAVLDLDHFKAYNDAYGHPAGDALLAGAAEAWSARLRETDLLARWGGEEFCVLLPGCSAEDAVAVMRDLRARTPNGQSFSAGVAAYAAGETADGLLQAADDALYEAKRRGRACDVVHAPTTA